MNILYFIFFLNITSFNFLQFLKYLTLKITIYFHKEKLKMNTDEVGLVASRGVNSRKSSKKDISNGTDIDDLALLELIKEKGIDFSLSNTTKQKLLKSLKKNELDVTVNEKRENDQLKTIEDQITELKEHFLNLENNSSSINSFGKIVASLMWEINIGMGNL